MERDVIQRLSQIIEPISKQSITSIGTVQKVKVSEAVTSIELDLLIGGYPFKDQLIDECYNALNDLKDHKKFEIHVHEKQEPFFPERKGLENVKHVIAVSSCKGGVGKSTVAVNLAFTLAQRGLKVGLLDADIYGPSLPSMVTPDDSSVGVRKAPGLQSIVLPLQRGNVKFLSFGHVNPKALDGAGGKTAAVLRGPIATRVISQLVTGTLWGDLDYLIVDLPPGTGDIQITLTQMIGFTGAVIVTTPHPLAIADVVKGIEMFYSLKIPSLSLVENMSYFKCSHGEVYFPFGKLSQQKLRKEMMLASDPNYVQSINVHSFPLSSQLSDLSGSLTEEASDQSSTAAEDENDDLAPRIPFVERHPNSEVAERYSHLCDDVLSEVFKIQLNSQLLPQLAFLEKKKLVILRYYTSTQAIEYHIPSSVLRYSDPLTGKKLIPPGSSEEELRRKYEGVVPTRFDMKGNYGVSILWSDGFNVDIFPFEILKRISEDYRGQSDNGGR